MWFSKSERIKELENYVEMLEYTLSYLRENIEFKIDKRITAYQKDAHYQLMKELDYWRNRAELLQRQVDLLKELVPCTAPIPCEQGSP